MSGKISKTARASIGKEKKVGKLCPECGHECVATKIVKGYGFQGGMFWVCGNCEYREKI